MPVCLSLASSLRHTHFSFLMVYLYLIYFKDILDDERNTQMFLTSALFLKVDVFISVLVR
jgi:hypothetical protein